MHRLFTACMLIVLGFSVFAPARAEISIPARIVTLKPHGQDDSRYRYVEILLEKVLERTGAFAQVAQATTQYSRDRLLQELIKGENIHVIAEAPKPGWEDKLLPIRIPIRKGVQGYRLFLINKQDQAALAQVDTLEELQALPTGSGAQWSTRKVMEQAGFQVVTSEDYEALFKMLKLRRFVTFGRGINEVFKEQESFVGGNENLIVEKTLCLFIPLPTYFFVSPAHPELAQVIEIGLKQMIADGSFDQHFLDFHHADLSRANLSERRIFSISNPNLSDQTPINEPSYWLDPASLGGTRQENDS